MHKLSVVLLFLIIGMGCNNHHSGQENSAYAGQEDQQIKSLTDQEVQAHLQMEQLLSDEQVEQYRELRGYGNATDHQMSNH